MHILVIFAPVIIPPKRYLSLSSTINSIYVSSCTSWCFVLNSLNLVVCKSHTGVILPRTTYSRCGIIQLDIWFGSWAIRYIGELWANRELSNSCLSGSALNQVRNYGIFKVFEHLTCKFYLAVICCILCAIIRLFNCSVIVGIVSAALSVKIYKLLRNIRQYVIM
jgi:hypothetical protein